MNANELMGQLLADHKTEIIEKAVAKLAARLAKVCMPDAEKLFREKIHEAASVMASQKLADISGVTFRETDSYGCVRNDTTLTLLDILRVEAKSWLEAKVTRNGNPSRERSDLTRAQRLVEKAAEDLIMGELSPAITKAKADLKKAVENKLSAAFVKTLREVS